MSTTRKIFKVVFFFILPLMMLINFCTYVEWTAEYKQQGSSYLTVTSADGFPFADSAVFEHSGTYFYSTHLLRFVANQSIIFLASFLLYYFVLRRINFTGLKRVRILFICICTFIYIYCSPILGILSYQRFFRNGFGGWPEKVEFKDPHAVNLWTAYYQLWNRGG